MSVIRSFSEADIARVLTFEELIPAMERALAAFSAGEVIQPVRSVLTLEPGQRYLGVMPAATQEAMGAKLVSFYPKNAGTEVPTHMASIALFDSATGRPLAFLDGRLITEMRTAAVSAAVTRHLAPGEARVLALIGSGVQARARSEEHTSELQSQSNLVCRLLLEKKKDMPASDPAEPPKVVALP